jgi:hypothetical protein
MNQFKILLANLFATHPLTGAQIEKLLKLEQG